MLFLPVLTIFISCMAGHALLKMKKQLLKKNYKIPRG